jgi:hypothetical protein
VVQQPQQTEENQEGGDPDQTTWHAPQCPAPTEFI